MKKEEKEDILFKVEMVQPLGLRGPFGPPRKMSAQDIGKLKPYKGIFPEVIGDMVVEKHFPTTQCVEEEAKLKCWLALFQLCNERDVDTTHVGFCTTGEIFSEGKVAKHGMLFVPVTDSASKISIVAAVDPKINASWAHSNGLNQDLASQAFEAQGGQMVPKKVSSNGIEFTCFTYHEGKKRKAAS